MEEKEEEDGRIRGEEGKEDEASAVEPTPPCHKHVFIHFLTYRSNFSHNVQLNLKRLIFKLCRTFQRKNDTKAISKPVEGNRKLTCQM